MNDTKEYKFYNWRNRTRRFLEYEFSRFTVKLFKKECFFKYKRIDGKRIMNQRDTNALIAHKIKEGEPFWVGRYGHTELGYINAVLNKRYTNLIESGWNWNTDRALAQLCNNAGFFPKDENYGERYVDLMLKEAANMDLHCSWHLFMEDYVIKKYEKNTQITRWFIQPHEMRKNLSGIPWSHALKGKKVLVISPFSESISKQYNTKREHIFDKIYSSEEILPEFELLTLKSVQTIAGTVDERFDDWFEALNWMTDRCKEIDFDVAIIGCGAYGFLLASEIKKMGKIAIQLCGATQVMFGVAGGRWMDSPEFLDEVYNENWIRPDSSEKPQGAEKIENGCYW